MECLNSVSRINYPAFSIVVVDNGSTDGSPDSIEKWSHLNSPVKLIRNSKNRGFVAGSNQAMRFALTTLTNYMFLLNNDTIVEPNILTHLVAEAEQDADIGMVGPKIYQHGQNLIIDSVGTKTLNWLAQAFLVGHNEKDTGQYDITGDMPYITGTALLVKRSVLHTTGLMDEDYFNYFYDYDWGFRACMDGFRLKIVPQAIIHHKGSKAIGFGSPFYIYHMVRSRILFARKHISLIPFSLLFLPYLFVYRYIRPIISIIIWQKWDHLRSLHQGIWNGFSTKITKP